MSLESDNVVMVGRTKKNKEGDGAEEEERFDDRSIVLLRRENLPEYDGEGDVEEPVTDRDSWARRGVRQRGF